MSTRRLLMLLFLALIAEASFAAAVDTTMVREEEVDAAVPRNQEQAEHDTSLPNSSESKRVWGAADAAEMHREASRGAEVDEATNRVATEQKNLDDEGGESRETDAVGRETKGVWGGTSAEVQASKPSSDDAPASKNREESPAEDKQRDEAAADSKESKRVWGAAASEAEEPVERRVTKEEVVREASNVDKVKDVGVDSPTTTVEENATDSKRVWGAAGDQSKSSPTPTASSPSVSEETPSHTIPFVATKHLHGHHNHIPPEGFSLAARVYIDSKDKLAHFDYSTENQRITLPYWDCGASGSTTSPLPLKNAYFRHSLAAPTSWSSSETGDGMHPVLVVALTPFVIELNSGESLEFDVGDVILLEDCLRPGHRMRPLHSTASNSGNILKALFVTLPQQHYHAGKQYFSLKKAVTQKQAPCTDLRSEGQRVDSDALSSAAASTTVKPPRPDFPGLVQKPFMPDFWDTRRIRLFLLGTVGLSLSTLAADFLGKTAPLWLAVGVGGTCFVAGSTYGLTVAGDYVLTQLELWFERRRLEPNRKERKA